MRYVLFLVFAFFVSGCYSCSTTEKEAKEPPMKIGKLVVPAETLTPRTYKERGSKASKPVKIGKLVLPADLKTRHYKEKK